MRVLPKIFQSKGRSNSIQYLVITRSCFTRRALKFVAIRSVVLQRKFVFLIVINDITAWDYLIQYILNVFFN